MDNHAIHFSNNNNNNNNGTYIALIHRCSKRFTGKKGHENIIKHKLTYNPTVQILKKKERKETNKNKNENKYDETKCHIPF